MRLPTSLLIALLLCPAPRTTLADDLYAAFWNVENLFDTTDDPAVKLDEEFTPAGPKEWTPQRFGTKCKSLARVIRDMNGDRGPDLLGLAEVENRAVVETLIEHLKPLGRDYDVVHQDSPSRRGIDCALIYDRKALRLKRAAFHTVHDRTREILEAELTAGGETLFVFVNHWPSRGSDREGIERIVAARTLRTRIDAILGQAPDADILILGDMNDYPTDPSLRKHLKASGELASLSRGELYNSTWPIHEQPDAGTYNYRGKWQVLDHVILSRGLLDSRAFHWKPLSTKVIVNDYQLHAPGTAEARPKRTYERDRYVGGASDHLPVACVIQLEARSSTGSAPREP